MKRIRKNKDPDTILNVSYREYIKPFTKVNTENIYLDNAFIQQVFIFLNSLILVSSNNCVCF